MRGNRLHVQVGTERLLHQVLGPSKHELSSHSRVFGTRGEFSRGVQPQDRRRSDGGCLQTRVLSRRYVQLPRPARSVAEQRRPFRSGWQVSAREQQEPYHQGSGVGVGQGGVVPGGGDRRADRWGAHPGAAHHAGPAHAAQREQASAGPAAADAVPAALQFPWTPRQKGPRGQAGPGVHGARDGSRELLFDLRQNATVGPWQRQNPLVGALGDVQRPREVGVCMIRFRDKAKTFILSGWFFCVLLLMLIPFNSEKKVSFFFFFFVMEKKQMNASLAVLLRSTLLEIKAESTRSCR
ncbi:hypothetical protein AAFF_G00039860 [Aldrovandia affinis]|uniref:Uncharacterized protein n=1 Tax=Aldrovandia affinis TaxID=143900 RepID=A0AAD7S2X4_9TELE|nr:hypothetical protein AAFF_G00039860 [Aldrovandia affinis]